MRPLRALGIYIAVVFVGGALLAPWLYWLAQSLSNTGVAQTPFQRFVTSSFMVVAIGGLWPLLRALGAKSFREVGLAGPVEHRKELLQGICFGLCSLAVVAAITLAAGGRVLITNNTVGRLIWKLSGAFFTAAGVAVLEETLFRGGVFGGLRRVFHWQFALLISSLIYAFAHFLEDANFQGAVTWLSGLELLPRMMSGWTNWRELVPGFFNLTLAGLLLGLAYQRTGNLWFSIGLHAGWVFWLAGYRLFTQDAPGANDWFWGSGRMIDGWLASLALSLTLAVFMRLPLARKNSFSG